MLKKRIDFLVLLSIFILVGLSFLGMLPSPAYEIVYILIFALPAVAAFVYSKLSGEGCALPLKLKREDFGELLPLVFPSVMLIMLLSVLTTFILGLFGKENSVVIYDTLTENLVRHAVLPAILEEIAFRYVPLVLLTRISRRTCVFVSALIFAMIHANLFQIPYAFLAGVIFISIDIIYDSILPSLILHLINNTLSVISIYYNVTYPIVVPVIVIGILSIIVIYKKRENYLDRVREVFSDKCQEKLSYSLLFVVIPTLLLAILNLTV